MVYNYSRYNIILRVIPLVMICGYIILFLLDPKIWYNFGKLVCNAANYLTSHSDDLRAPHIIELTRSRSILEVITSKFNDMYNFDEKLFKYDLEVKPI